MSDCCRSFAVELRSFVLVAQLLVGLGNHGLDEGVVLVCLLQFLKGRLVISRIECDIALQVRKELGLLGIGPPVENVLRGSDMLLRFSLIPTSGTDTSLSVLPTELPKVLASRFDVGFLQSIVVAYLIPVIGGVQVA